MTTHQQQLAEERESERQRISSALVKPNSVSIKKRDGFNGLAACDNSERRPVYVTLDRPATLALFDDLLDCLDIADLQHVMARAIERQRAVILRKRPAARRTAMSNGALVVLSIDDVSKLTCIPLQQSPKVSLMLSPSVDLHVAYDQIPSLIALLQSAVPAPVEERVDEIRGAA